MQATVGRARVPAETCNGNRQRKVRAIEKTSIRVQEPLKGMGVGRGEGNQRKESSLARFYFRGTCEMTTAERAVGKCAIMAASIGRARTGQALGVKNNSPTGSN